MILGIIGIFIILIIIGALTGGDNIGEMLRGGCGCIAGIIFIIIIVALVLIMG